jgi:ribonuclease-3 family protein
MDRLFGAPCNRDAISPLTLALIGDGVYDLMVRERLVCMANRPVGVLHQEAVKQVCCRSQALAMEKLLPQLTEHEAAVYKRGRNAHTTHTPKNAQPSEYHSATGMEALFGYLYLGGELERLRALFSFIMEEAG